MYEQNAFQQLKKEIIVKKQIILLVGALCCASFGTVYALPRTPDCNAASPECREWRQAVSILNEDAASLNTISGERGMKPRRPIDTKKAMQACIRYLKRDKRLSTTEAEKTCKEELAP